MGANGERREEDEEHMNRRYKEKKININNIRINMMFANNKGKMHNISSYYLFWLSLIYR